LRRRARQSGNERYFQWLRGPRAPGPQHGNPIETPTAKQNLPLIEPSAMIIPLPG
jgi:hypothetical protein